MTAVHSDVWRTTGLGEETNEQITRNTYQAGAGTEGELRREEGPTRRGCCLRLLVIDGCLGR